MIIGVCGLAGSGKDTTADYLQKKYKFAKVALADPLKRICREVYEFTDEQLWGPSSERNKPDTRYVQRKAGALGYTFVGEIDLFGTMFEQHRHLVKDGLIPNPPEDVYLTPRFALQQLGTEWGRSCYDNTWIDLALRTAHQLKAGGCYYSPSSGLRAACYVDDPTSPIRAMTDVVFSDIRFSNEVEAIKADGGQVWRLMRGTTLQGEAAQHDSETAIGRINPELFDHVFENHGTLEELYAMIDKTMVESGHA